MSMMHSASTIGAKNAGPEPVPTVSLNTAAVNHTTALGTTYANLQYNSSGLESSNTNGFDNQSTARGTWLDSGSNSNVWLERTINSGTLFVDPGAGRLIMSSTRTFKVRDTDSSPASVSCNMDIEMWDAASGGNIIDSVNGLILLANYDNPCPLCCFTPDTPVLMADGKTMPIGDVREGDLIKVKNGIQSVTEVLTRERRAMYAVLFEDGRSLRMSDDHPIYIEGKGWSAINPVAEYKDLGMAKTLEVGDRAVGESGKSNKVVMIQQIEYPDTVYTFANSGFFANGMLVY